MSSANEPLQSPKPLPAESKTKRTHKENEESDEDILEDRLDRAGTIARAKIHGNAQRILSIPSTFPPNSNIDFCDDCNLPVETPGVISKYPWCVDPKKLACAGYGVYLYFFFIKYIIINLIGLIIITVLPYIYLTQVYSDELFNYCTEFYNNKTALTGLETNFDKCINFVDKKEFDYTSFDWFNVWSCETMVIYAKLLTHTKGDTAKNELLVNFNLITFVTLIVLVIVNMLFISLSSAIVNEIDFNEESPSDYTLMISDIPTTENTEEFIIEFLKDKNVPPIHEVNLTYRISHLMKTQAELLELIKLKRINKGKEMYTTGICCCKKEHPMKELKEKINTMKKDAEVLDNEKDITFTGVAFVTFNRQDEQEAYYDMFPNSSLTKILINLGSIIGLYLCCCFLSQERKRRWRRKVTITVAKAPEPEDIIWKHLEYQSLSRFGRSCVGYLVCLICIGASFGIVLLLNIVQYDADITYQNDIILKYGISVAISCVIQIINFVVSMIFSFFAMFEKPWSYTNYHLSLSLKLTFFIFVNSAIIPLVTNIVQYGANGFENLVNNMLMMFLMASILSPCLSLISYDLLLVKIKQWLFEKLTKDPESSIPSKTQRELNELYEYPDMCIDVKYSQLAMSFLISCFYMSIFPFGTIIALVGAILVYFVEKFKFTKIYKKPKMFNQTLCFFYIDHFVFGLFLYSIGHYIFLHDILKNNVWELVNIILFGILTIIPYKKLFRLCDASGAYSASNEIVFEDAYFSFPFDYERMNPKTQKEGMLNYLKRLKTKHIITDEQYEKAQRQIKRINVMELYHATQGVGLQRNQYMRNKTKAAPKMKINMDQFNSAFNQNLQQTPPGQGNLLNGQLQSPQINNDNTNLNPANLNINAVIDMNYDYDYYLMQQDMQRDNIQNFFMNLEVAENPDEYYTAQENYVPDNYYNNNNGYDVLQVNNNNNNPYPDLNAYPNEQQGYNSCNNNNNNANVNGNANGMMVDNGITGVNMNNDVFNLNNQLMNNNNNNYQSNYVGY